MLKISPIKICLLGLIIVSSCKTPSILVTEEQMKGDEYSNNYDYENAIAHYKNSLSESRKLGVYRNLEIEADICRKIAYAYNVQGKFQDAFDYNYYAYRRDSALNLDLEILEDLREMGKTCLYMGDFKKGIAYLDTVIDKSTHLSSSIKSTKLNSIAETHLTLAQLKSVLGKYDECKQHSMEALKINENLNNKQGIMECELLLGKITNETASPLVAVKHLLKSQKLAEELNLNTSRQLHILANIAEAKASYQDAVNLRLSSIKEAQKVGIIPQEIWALLKTGDTYALIGDHERAESYYNKAIALKDSSKIYSKAINASIGIRDKNSRLAINYYSEIGADISLALAYLKLGDLFLKRSNYGFALSQYTKAKNKFSEINSNEGLAKAAVMLADVNVQMKQFDKAKENLDLTFSNTQQAEILWKYHYLKGLIFEENAQKDEAIESWGKSIQIIESIRGNITIDELKSTYINDKIIVYDKLINMYMMNGKPDKAFEYAERARARAFLDLIGNKEIKFQSRQNNQLTSLENKLRSQIQTLTRILHQSDLGVSRGINRDIVFEELQRARSEYENLMIEIKLNSPSLASIVSITPANANNLNISSDPNTAYVVYWTGSEKSFAWVIIDNKTQSIEIPYTEEELIDIVQKCRDILPQSIKASKQEDFMNAPSMEPYKEAYKMLYAPLEESLQGINQIGIVPHKALHLLPFQCLIDRNNKFLIEQKRIYYTPSISSLNTIRNTQSTDNSDLLAMALGNLKLFGFEGLPGTKSETQQITSQYENSMSLYDEDAKESYFKKNAENYGHIHLATHGYMDQEQPLFSFLLLSPDDQNDGLLTVSEVFELSLNADLVVLSACQTGLGKLSQGDDVVGLSRAMLYAGASNVVVSLWSVADKETAYLMTEFYKHLQSYDAVKALQLAQLSTLKKYKSPYYWAPFQLIGAGD